MAVGQNRRAIINKKVVQATEKKKIFFPYTGHNSMGCGSALTHD
jgi:hypothetical protein